MGILGLNVCEFGLVVANFVVGVGGFADCILLGFLVVVVSGFLGVGVLAFGCLLGLVWAGLRNALFVLWGLCYLVCGGWGVSCLVWFGVCSLDLAGWLRVLF